MVVAAMADGSRWLRLYYFILRQKPQLQLTLMVFPNRRMHHSTAPRIQTYTVHFLGGGLTVWLPSLGMYRTGQTTSAQQLATIGNTLADRVAG